MRYPKAVEPMDTTLKGLRFVTEFMDLKSVDVSYSSDKKSFDAAAILRSTYHSTFLERDLASLPEPAEELEEDLQLDQAPGRARRGAGPTRSSTGASLTTSRTRRTDSTTTTSSSSSPLSCALRSTPRSASVASPS